VRRWHDIEIDTAALDAVERLDMQWATAVLGDLSGQDWPAVFARVGCPVLVGLGASDYVVPPSLWDDVTAPAFTTFVTFERSGHTAFFEQPEEFTTAVRAWLDALPR
jgi:pimeloyl-ACP methyl ester carboxylesterase